MTLEATAIKSDADPDGVEFWNRRLEEMAREAGPALRDDIARLVAVLEEAGEPLGTTEASWRLTDAGATSDWVVVYMTALKEGAVWTPETGMVSIPPKRQPRMPPEERALYVAFDKAEELGVVRHTGERFVFTDRQDDGLLEPAELEKAERMMNRCNALAASKVHDMYIRCYEGKVTREELDEYTGGVIERAEAQPLVHAQARERRLAQRGATASRHHAPQRRKDAAKTAATGP